MKKGKALRLPFFYGFAGFRLALELPTDYVHKLVENPWD